VGVEDDRHDQGGEERTIGHRPAPAPEPESQAVERRSDRQRAEEAGRGLPESRARQREQREQREDNQQVALGRADDPPERRGICQGRESPVVVVTLILIGAPYAE
jgi:hypothetical protein